MVTAANPHDRLLKLLSEQRSRDILAMAAVNRTPAPASSIGTAFPPTSAPSLESLIAEQQKAREADHQRLLMLAQAERELLIQQHQRKEDALRMAIIGLKSRQNAGLL